MSGSNGMLTAEELEQIMDVSEKFIAAPLSKQFKESIDGIVKSIEKLNEKMDRLYAVSEQQFNAVCKHDIEIKTIETNIKKLNTEVFENIPKEKTETRKWKTTTGIAAGGLGLSAGGFIVLLLQKFGIIK